MQFGIRAGVRRLLGLPRRTRAAIRVDMDEELRFFLDARVERLVASGLSPAAAEEEAIRRLGNTIQETRERLHHSAERRERRMKIHERLGEVMRDVRYAARALAAARGFSTAVIVTLGLGIGANAAMFGIIDRLLFRPPAYLRDPGNVNRVYFVRTIDGVERPTRNFQYRRYLEMRQWSTSFDRTAGFFFSNEPVGEGLDASDRLVGAVSASFFGFFDAPPALGRYFTTAEDSTAAEAHVAVLAYGHWRTHFGGRPNVLGERIRIGPHSFEIIGVAAKGFVGVDGQAPAVFIPLTTLGRIYSGADDATMYYARYDMSWMEMMVHRPPGVTVPAATADLTAAYQRSYAAQREAQPRVLPAEVTRPHAVAGLVQRERGMNQGNDAKVAMWLGGVTLIVLLVACANVANLLLARAFGRRREIAVRLALGVSRGRLIGQLLTESLLIAMVGGVAGLAVAQWGGTVLKALFLPDVEWKGALVDGRTLLFTAVATLAAGVLAGIAPALHARHGDLAAALKAGPREGTYHRSRTRVALLVLQGALSVVLLVGAGLFVRSLRNVNGLRLGYDPERLLHVGADMRSTTLTREELAALKRRLRERAATLPGVESAARAVTVPFWQTIDFPIYVPGIDSTGRIGNFALQAVSPEYFRTTGTRLLRGRGIEATDVSGAPLAIVVSEAMAKGLWPNDEPIGKCVKLGADTMPCHTVVGVAENIRRESLSEDPGLQYYIPVEQRNPAQGGLFVRTRRDAAGERETVRRELQRLMPGDALVTVRPMSEILGPIVRSWHLGATLFVAFGGLALVLATIGLYSVIAYNVAQRTHELGVRVALGAQGRDVVGLVLGQGLRLAVVGVALGVGAALWAARFIEPLLFGESPRDPIVFGIVAASLLATAMLASLIPARRATRVDPLTALRSE